MATLQVADFVPYPGGRFVSDGEYSGEWFREQILVPALNQAIQNHEKLTVILDGVPGYGISFLEEAFGGIIREGKVDARNAPSRFFIFCKNCK